MAHKIRVKAVSKGYEYTVAVNANFGWKNADKFIKGWEPTEKAANVSATNSTMNI